MKSTLKKILTVLIGIGIFFYIILVIYGFIHSWKAGLIWLVGAFFTIGLLGTIIDKAKPTTKGLKIFMAVISFIAFVIGVQFLPKELRERKAKSNTEITDKTIKENTKPVFDSLKLKAFQKDWTDSIVKDWKGSYISKGNISNNSDTIYFELTKEGSKGNWRSTSDLHQSIYQKDYDSLILKNFGNDFDNIKTKIVFVPNSEQQKENDIKAERKHLIERQFSAWDGSNRNVEKYIKENMNDPSSYDHVETNYSDKGTFILVQTKFRGKNAFGAKVLQMATAKVDIEGNILSFKLN
jgi:hypothetical protein